MIAMTTEAYIFEAIRTPRGRGKPDGALHEVKPIELVTTLLHELQQRHDLDTSQVDDVVLGCVTPIGDQGADIAKIAAQYAGWDIDVPGMQLNRFCASGLEAVNLAAMKVRSGWEALVVAGGVESMSRVRLGSDGGPMYDDPAVSQQISFVPQGISADLIATLEGFSREDVDRYALQSQQRATQATKNGHFAKSLIPVKNGNGQVALEQDEHIRPESTLAGLGQLKPAFQTMGEQRFDAIALKKYPQVDHIEHVHTAGNASGIVDGAALVLVGSKEKGEALGLKPRARVVAAALVGTEPTIMLVGPAPASQKALKMAGMTLTDIDLIEINEAFAAVVLKFLREMRLDSTEHVNVNGGAIALGHPLGATGAMLVGTVLDELERCDLETGLITLCVGGGMGIATIIERV
jgi:acetyl-CoA C-acetyltransferase